MRMRHHLAAAGVIVAAMTTVAVGCGGGHHAQSQRPRPTLPHALAVQLASASGDVARKLDAGDACGALAAARTLQQRTIAAINGGKVPGPLQEPLQSTVSDLAGRIRCRPQPAPAPPTAPAKEHDHGHKNHSKHKGHGGKEDD